MAKQFGGDFKFDIQEFIAPLSESTTHDWITGVALISWNDKPAKIEIRNMNLAQNKVGKGIGLTDEEADKVVDIFLDRDYGSMESIEAALKRKRSRFTVLADAVDAFTDEGVTVTMILGDDYQ